MLLIHANFSDFSFDFRMSLSGSSAGFDGGVLAEDGSCKCLVNHFVKKWIECGPTWLKMLCVAGEAGGFFKVESAAVRWFLCAFKAVDGVVDSELADISFLRQEHDGRLILVNFRFEKETGMARLRFTEEVDEDWSTGCCVPMCVGVAASLDVMFEEYRLVTCGRAGNIVEARKILTEDSFSKVVAGKGSKSSVGSVSCGVEGMSVEVRARSRVIPPSPAVNAGSSAVMEVEAAVPAVTTVGSGTGSTGRPRRVVASLARVKSDNLDDSSVASSSSSEWNGVDDRAADVWKCGRKN